MDYDNSEIKINPVRITGVSDVDESTSTKFRLTVLPNSNDIVPVRNQLLELDLTNTTVSYSWCSCNNSKGYRNTTATTTQTTSTTASTTPTTSGY